MTVVRKKQMGCDENNGRPSIRRKDRLQSCHAGTEHNQRPASVRDVQLQIRRTAQQILLHDEVKEKCSGGGAERCVLYWFDLVNFQHPQ